MDISTNLKQTKKETFGGRPPESHLPYPQLRGLLLRQNWTSPSVCLRGFPTQWEQVRHQPGAVELSLMREEAETTNHAPLQRKQTVDSEFSELCPDPKTDFSKVIFLFSPQWRHAGHLTFTRGESCPNGSLAPSEMWATGSELYCESTGNVMTQRWKRVCVCVCTIHCWWAQMNVIEKEIINWKFEK